MQSRNAIVSIREQCSPEIHANPVKGKCSGAPVSSQAKEASEGMIHSLILELGDGELTVKSGGKIYFKRHTRERGARETSNVVHVCMGKVCIIIHHGIVPLDLTRAKRHSPLLLFLLLEPGARTAHTHRSLV